MGKLTLSAKERKRLELFAKVKRRELSLRKAAALLHMSYRQARRCYRLYKDEGDRGLVHRLRGRASNRRADHGRRAAIVQRYRERYADFGPTLAAEYLAQDKLVVPVQTLRRWLMEEGLWQVKRR